MARHSKHFYSLLWYPAEYLNVQRLFRSVVLQSRLLTLFDLRASGPIFDVGCGSAHRTLYRPEWARLSADCAWHCARKFDRRSQWLISWAALCNRLQNTRQPWMIDGYAAVRDWLTKFLAYQNYRKLGSS
jgi:hypothetical protein